MQHLRFPLIGLLLCTGASACADRAPAPAASQQLRADVRLAVELETIESRVPRNATLHSLLTRHIPADLAGSVALADSFAFCDKAWSTVGGARGAAAVDLFGMKFTGASAMSFNSAHDWEHYGNIVTYMRLKGMVPPSSQGGGMN